MIGLEKADTVEYKKAGIREKDTCEPKIASTTNKKMRRKGTVEPKKTNIANQDKIT